MTAPEPRRLSLDLGDIYELGACEFSALDLFLFSAAGWHPHRIHFDLPYAQSEGHPDLVVHGPLQAVHLFQTLAALLPAGAAITRTSYRHRAPLYAGSRAQMFAEVTTAAPGGELEVAVWFEDATGRKTTTGTALVRLEPVMS